MDWEKMPDNTKIYHIIKDVLQWECHLSWEAYLRVHGVQEWGLGAGKTFTTPTHVAFYRYEGGISMSEADRDHWILNDQGEPIPEPDIIKWGKWLECTDRQIEETFFAGESIRVSTVFLSLSHINKHTGDEGMLYETMVFADHHILASLQALSETDDRGIIAIFIEALGGSCPEIQKRYTTRQEAVQGHKTMCTFIETCLIKGLLPLTSAADIQEE